MCPICPVICPVCPVCLLPLECESPHKSAQTSRLSLGCPEFIPGTLPGHSDHQIPLCDISLSVFCSPYLGSIREFGGYTRQSGSQLSCMVETQKYPQYCWELQDNSSERLSPEPLLKKRGVPSHTGGETILEMLWKLHMP